MKIKSTTMLLAMLVGWLKSKQSEVIDYLIEENRILKEKCLAKQVKKRIILNDKQRRRLGILAQRVGRKMLFEISCVFAPDTFLKWFSQLAGK
ncbi:MAG: hypothetical protein ACYTBP_03245 [Planctomycetota bacterium]|jgi:hypothetical protein